MPKPTRQDVLTLGLPAPAVASPGCLVERADASTGLLYFRAHGLSDGDLLTLRLASSTTTGAPATSLPGGLAEGTTYEVEPVTADAFRLRTVGGSALTTFSSAGSGRIYYLADPWAALDRAIDRAWTVVQSDCTAHGGDVDAPLLTDAAAALAARMYIDFTSAQDPAKEGSYDALRTLYAEVYAPKLAAFFRGAPVRGAVDATPAKAENGALVRRIGATASAELV